MEPGAVGALVIAVVEPSRFTRLMAGGAELEAGDELGEGLGF